MLHNTENWLANNARHAQDWLTNNARHAQDWLTTNAQAATNSDAARKLSSATGVTHLKNSYLLIKSGRTEDAKPELIEGSVRAAATIGSIILSLIPIYMTAQVVSGWTATKMDLADANQPEKDHNSLINPPDDRDYVPAPLPVTPVNVDVVTDVDALLTQYVTDPKGAAKAMKTRFPGLHETDEGTWSTILGHCLDRRERIGAESNETGLWAQSTGLFTGTTHTREATVKGLTVLEEAAIDGLIQKAMYDGSYAGFDRTAGRDRAFRGDLWGPLDRMVASEDPALQTKGAEVLEALSSKARYMYAQAFVKANQENLADHPGYNTVMDLVLANAKDYQPSNTRLDQYSGDNWKPLIDTLKNLDDPKAKEIIDTVVPKWMGRKTVRPLLSLPEGKCTTDICRDHEVKWVRQLHDDSQHGKTRLFPAVYGLVRKRLNEGAPHADRMLNELPPAHLVELWHKLATESSGYRGPGRWLNNNSAGVREPLRRRADKMLAKMNETGDRTDVTNLLCRAVGAKGGKWGLDDPRRPQWEAAVKTKLANSLYPSDEYSMEYEKVNAACGNG